MSWVIGLTKLRMMFARPMLLICMAMILIMLGFVYTQIGFEPVIFAALGAFLLAILAMYLIFPRYKAWHIGFLRRNKWFRWYVGALIILGLISYFVQSLLN